MDENRLVQPQPGKMSVRHTPRWEGHSRSLALDLLSGKRTTVAMRTLEGHYFSVHCLAMARGLSIDYTASLRNAINHTTENK